MCFNPLVSLPDAAFTRAALERRDFYVAIDFFLSETSRHADLVLPVLVLCGEWAARELEAARTRTLEVDLEARRRLLELAGASPSRLSVRHEDAIRQALQPLDQLLAPGAHSSRHPVR